MISYMIIAYVTKHNKGVTPITRWSHMSQSHIIQLHDIEKIIEGSGINDIIQHNNSMLAL